jgi:molybdopterin converting factor small subunit
VIVVVRCLASLAAHAPPDGRLSLAPGATVDDAVRALCLASGELGTVLRNGGPASGDTPLAPDDRLSFVPPITGG